MSANVKNQNCDIFNCHGVDIDSNDNGDGTDDGDEEEPDEDYVEVE